jgi:hypothetical protein
MRTATGLAIGMLWAGAAMAAPCGVIDVHLHAYEGDGRFGAGMPNPISGMPPPKDGAAHRSTLLATLARDGVERGIIDSQAQVAAEAAVGASGGRLRLGYQINNVPGPNELGEIRALHAAGRLTMIGEVGTPYMGIAWDDPRLEPLWALAEELDLPVALHTGSGPPDAWRGAPMNRIRAGDVLALEDVIVRHPKLRVLLQHMGWPMGDDTIAMLNAYSQVYVDTGAIAWLVPEAEFHAYLKRLVDAGFGKRIVFGSDAMAWPDGVTLAIRAVRSARFLNGAQKRDILRNNAIRFFGWQDLATC